jgi:uncharacterized protein
MSRVRHRVPRVTASFGIGTSVLGVLMSAALVASAAAQPPPIPPGLIPDPGPVTPQAPKFEPQPPTPPARKFEPQRQPLTPPAPRAEPEPKSESKAEPKAQPKARPRPVARPAVPPPPASQPAPSQAAPSQPAPSQATPSQATPGQPMPSQLMPSQPMPAEAMPAPPASGGGVDIAYGAYQRGYYLTAILHATKRAEAAGDAKSMTLLGELYANGFGVDQDDNKAAEWYALAVDRGDREAMFALAMFRLTGRAGPTNREEATRLLAAAVKLGHTAAAFNLAMLYFEGEFFPQDFVRAAQLFHIAAVGGSPEAQYALGTLFKEGRGVQQKDLREAARWLGAAAAADHTDAQVEYAIALFHGNGVGKDEAGAAALLQRAARKGSPIAQNRLAQLLAAGRGLPADPVAAIKWHLVSKAGGARDLSLEEFMSQQTPEVRAAGEKAAESWLEAIKQSRS